jgi:AraC-like DNA-binding protein
MAVSRDEALISSQPQRYEKSAHGLDHTNRRALALVKNGRASTDSNQVPFGYSQAPTDAMTSIFQCTWQHRISIGGSHATQRILPDNCADFIVSDTGDSWLVGPATTVAIAAIPAGTTLRAIRIHTSAIRAVTDTDASELINRNVKIHDLLSSRATRLLTEALWEQAVTGALLTSLWPNLTLNPHVHTGVAALATRPDTAVADIAADLALSPRHFRRLVQQETGLPPKTIQRVNRVRRVLDLSVLWNCRHLSTLAAAAGYVDQAHLARDVRQIADLTPTQFVRQHATT